MFVVDVPPSMRQACRFRRSPGFVYRTITAVSIRLQHAAVFRQVPLRVATLKIRRVRERLHQYMIRYFWY